MSLTRKMTVIAIHGEGNRQRLNSLQNDRNRVAAIDRAKSGLPPDPSLHQEADEPPHVTAVLRDEESHNRIELVMTTWEEVEEFKGLGTYDNSLDPRSGQPKNHWVQGVSLNVTFLGS